MEWSQIWVKVGTSCTNVETFLQYGKKANLLKIEVV